MRLMQTTFDQCHCAGNFGSDWVTVAEQHYSGFLAIATERIEGASIEFSIQSAQKPSGHR
jgi:hypothetical protein